MSYSGSTTKVIDPVFIHISLGLIMVQTQYNVKCFNGTSQGPERRGRALGRRNTKTLKIAVFLLPNVDGNCKYIK